MNKWKIRDIQYGVGGFKVIEENLIDTPVGPRTQETIFMSQEAKLISERTLTAGKVVKRLRAMAENFIDRHNYAIDDERERLISTITGEIRKKKGPFKLIIDRREFPFQILQFTERLAGIDEPDSLAVDFKTKSGIEATLILRKIDNHEIDFIVE